jgi:adenylylsulfate kinase
MASNAESRTGFILWLTGLSGAGKSTISSALLPRLETAGRRVELLDGDVVRTHLTQGLGFSREDRNTNVRRIGWVAGLVARHGGVALAAVISPYREVRDELKRTYPNFIEVFIDTPIEICAARDVKGLYAKARAGEIKGFTGIDDPYEPPTRPDVVIRTPETTVDQAVDQIITHLRARGLVE